MSDILLEQLGIVSANIYFSGTCNLKCTYCFQPKVSSCMSEVNKNIINWITSGKMEEDIQKNFGNNILNMSFWGGEPTLNFHYLIERLPFIFDTFQKLESFDFSTNMSTKKIAENVLDFIKAVIEQNKRTNRKVKVSVQISLDGPPEINDKYRIGSSAKSIIENTTYLLEELSKINKNDLNIFISFKGTYDSEALAYLANKSNFIDFNSFYDNARYEWKQFCDFYPDNGGNITFVCPGEYTSEDGKNLAKILTFAKDKEVLNYPWKNGKIILHNQFTDRVNIAIDYLENKRISKNPSIYLYECNCSAGRSSLGISYDGKIHWCHSTYFYSDDIVNKIKDSNAKTYFEQGYKLGNYHKFMKNLAVVDQNDPLKILRSIYVARGAEEGFTIKKAYSELMINQLLEAGQISNIYKDQRWKGLAIAYFLYSPSGCIVDNLWSTGSVYTASASHYRLFLNGALEYYINRSKLKL